MDPGTANPIMGEDRELIHEGAIFQSTRSRLLTGVKLLVGSWSTRLQFSNLHTRGLLSGVELLVIMAAVFQFRDLWVGLVV
jgi:hypothetical protein